MPEIRQISGMDCVLLSQHKIQRMLQLSFIDDNALGAVDGEAVRHPWFQSFVQSQ
jgi:hypothetical protein